MNSRRDLFALLALGIFFGTIALLAWFKITDTDVAFHLAAGREILSLHRVPQTNTLGYTEPGAAWGSHQWLGSVLIYLTWRLGGDMGLAFMKLAVVLAIFAFLLRSLYRERWPRGFRFRGHSGDLVLALPILTLAAWAARSRLVERPLLFSALFEAILLWFLAGYETRSRRSLLWLIPIFVLWWNLHAGFIYGILILCAFIVGDILEPARRRAALRLARMSAIAVATGAAVTLVVNPGGVRALLFPLEMFRSQLFTQVIDEFHRTSLAANPAFTLLLVVVSAALVIGVLTGRRPRAAHVILVAGFGALALARVRMVLDMTIVTAPIAAGYLAAAIPLRLPRWAPMPAAIVGAVLVAFEVSRSVVHTFGYGLDARTYPAGAYEFMQRENPPGEVFVADMWSGSFLWRFYPQRKTFIHNQLEVYREPFWRDVYLPVLAADAGWQKHLDQRGVNTLLLRYSGDRYRQRIADAAFADPGWVLVYWDDLAMIFVRNNAAAEGVIQRHAFRVLNPEHPDIARLVATGRGPDAEQELARRLDDEPGCRRAWSYLGEVRLEMGQIAEGEEAFRRLGDAAQHPGEKAAALAGLARARWMSGEPARAESLFTEAITVRGEDTYLLARRARMRIETGNIAGAREDARRVASRRAVYPMDLVLLGESFAEAGEREEAALLFARAAQLSQGPAERARIHQREALAWERAGDRSRAEAAYRVAMKMDARWVDPVNNLAWLLLDAGRRDEALPLSHAAVMLAPRDGYPWGTHARALFEAGKIDSAVHAYEQAVALMGGEERVARATTMIGLARAYAAAGREADARRYVEDARALQLTPELLAQADSLTVSIGER